MKDEPIGKHLFRLWFGTSLAVSRKDYLRSGFGLMVLRCVGDALILIMAAGGAAVVSQWDPLFYLAPTILTRQAVIEPIMQNRSDAFPAALAMAIWALPFAWVGVSMSVRRARNAGLTPWLGLLFFVPLFNLLMIALLCALPHKPPKNPTKANADFSLRCWLAS